MDIPIEVTPQLLDVIDDQFLRSSARVDPDRIDSMVIRCSFVKWLNKNTQKLQLLLPGVYGVNYAYLAQFKYIGHFNPNTSLYVKEPINPRTVPMSAHDDIAIEYFITVAFKSINFDHDSFIAAFPLHVVDILVSIPRSNANMRFCGSEERPDARLNMPVLFERVVRVRQIPWSKTLQSRPRAILSKATVVSGIHAVHNSLCTSLEKERIYLPSYRESSPLSNRDLAGTVAKQWFYWMYDIGAEHLRCRNYALLCLLFGHQTITKLPDHGCLAALMYLVVLFPECLALPETVEFVCHSMRRAPFIRLATSLCSGSLFNPRSSLHMKRFQNLSKELLNDADFEKVADQFSRIRSELHHRCDVETLASMKKFNMVGEKIWGMPPEKDIEGKSLGYMTRSAIAHANKAMADVYARAKSRSVKIDTLSAQKLLANNILDPLIIEEESEDISFGNEYICSNAAQIDRVRLVRMLYEFFDLFLIQVMHYQTQLLSIQTCVSDHRLPYIMLCPNLALAEQAKHQWSGDMVFTLDEFGEILRSDRRQRVLFPQGMNASCSMIVMLHSEMFGIEQWLAIMERCIQALEEIAAETKKFDIMNTLRIPLLVVTDPFMMRPVIVRKGFPYGNVYGTESVVQQIIHCEAIVAKQIILVEPDIPEDNQRIPFMAGKIFYQLTNGKERQAKERRVREKLRQFLRKLVETMWLGEEDQTLEKTPDELMIRKIYIHTGMSDLTDRSKLTNTTFKQHDYIMVGDTGEMISLWTRHLVEGGQKAFDRLRYNQKIYKTPATAYICECSRPILYSNCGNIAYDRESPWCLHQEWLDNDVQSGIDDVDGDIPAKIESLTSGKPLISRRPDCNHIPRHGRKLDQSVPDNHVCFSRLMGDRKKSSLRGYGIHELFSCTRDCPARSSSYVGPNPDVVYINVPKKTSFYHFMHACSLARTHIQVVQSDQERDRNEEGEAIGRAFMIAGTTNYVMNLREAKSLGETQFYDTADRIISDLMERISHYASIYPEDGLWMEEILARCLRDND